MTGHMQDGVHAILQRLRRDAPAAHERIEDTLQAYCALWASHHEGIELRCEIEPLGELATSRSTTASASPCCACCRRA
jgi:two-component system sensor histidine kinase UhpB